ncbi:MAG: aryl-sulfate sulfotransferase [Flavobacteriales bacterium]|nr:aryl-sulfate sulfotransferase [Flavobacteriales bacterium]
MRTARLFLMLLASWPLALMAQLPAYVADGFPADGQGYYFITTADFGGGPAPSHGVILDGAGHVAFRKTAPAMSTFRAWPDGRMSYASSARHLFMDSTFAVIDTVVCANGLTNDTHDMRVLANGHYLLLGVETLTMDLSGYLLFPPGNAPGSSTAQVKSNVIQELDADENLVWEWHVADHFGFEEVDPARLTNPAVVDWSHCNAVEQDLDGNILLSCRHFNEVIKIDRATGDVLWHLGGASNDFTFTNDAGFFGQHDIRRLPNGDITLFDNGLQDTHPCRGVEYALDEGALTATLVWSREYGAPAWSRAMGSMQRLPNGGAVIGWGAITPDNAVFTTYAEDGAQVNELRFVDTLVTYRATYFEELPFAMPRPGVTCSYTAGEYVLAADAGWPSYQWSNGATTASITAQVGDTLWVEVPAAQTNGRLRSVPYVVGTDCLSMGQPEIASTAFRWYPNPATDFVIIEFKADGGMHDVEIIDATGRSAWHGLLPYGVARLPLSGIADGLLLLRIDGHAHRIVKQ